MGVYDPLPIDYIVVEHAQSEHIDYEYVCLIGVADKKARFVVLIGMADKKARFVVLVVCIKCLEGERSQFFLLSPTF